MQRDSVMIPPADPAEPNPLNIADSVAFYRMRKVYADWWFFLFPAEGDAIQSIGPLSWPRAEKVIVQLKQHGLADS